MRPWIDHLITHEGAYADFNAYIKEIEHEINKRIILLLKKDQIPEAKDLATELGAYKTISDKIKACARERRSQITYQEQITN